MMDRWTRLLPVTGIIFVGLLVALIVSTGNTPNSDAKGVDVIKYYKDHRTAQLVGNLLGAIAVIFFYGFAATLRAKLRDARVEGLATFGFGGAIALGIGGAIFSALGFSLADVPDKLDPAAAQALNVLSNDFFFPFGVGVAVFMIGNGLGIIKSRILPVWLGWIALPIGLVAASPAGFFAFNALLAWVLVVSTLWLIRGRQAVTSPAT